MQELKKILEEIEQLVNMHYEDDSVKTIILRNLRGIRKHMSGKDTGVPTNDGWIPVGENLPGGNKTVLVCQRGGAINVAWHDGYRWKTGFSHADWLVNFIAWQPLPEPYRPKNESEDSRRLREREEFFKG